MCVNHPRVLTAIGLTLALAMGVGVGAAIGRTAIAHTYPVHHSNTQTQEPEVEPGAEPSSTAQIVFLNPQERRKRTNSELSNTELDNPLINNYHFAVVRFTNLSSKRLSAYSFIDNPSRALTFTSCIIIQFEVRDPAGWELITMVPGSSSYTLDLPDSWRLSRYNTSPKPKVWELMPGESIELPFRVLGRLPARLTHHGSPRTTIEPGEYTVRAHVRYPEAPSGVVRDSITPPVKVTIHPEQVDEAVRYYNSH